MSESVTFVWFYWPFLMSTLGTNACGPYYISSVSDRLPGGHQRFLVHKS